MLPYYALIGGTLIFAIYYELYCERTCLKEKKNYTIVFFFTIYLFLLAFRSENVGTDTYRYLEIYEIISNSSWISMLLNFGDSDIGYYVLNKVIAIFFDNSQWLLIFTSIMIIVPVAKLYFKESKNSLMSIALYMAMPIFLMNFSGIRQSMAMAFVGPAIYYIRERKKFKFIAIVLIASLFHSSAFIMLAMYPLYYVSISLKHLIVLMPIALIVLKYNSTIYMFFIKFMPESYKESFGYTTETGAYTMIILFGLFLLYAFLFVDENNLNENEKGLRNFLIIAFFLQLFAPVNTIAMRMNYYYIILIPLIIPYITNNLIIKDGRIKLIISVLIYSLFTTYYLYKASVVDNLGIYPYEFFWQT